MEVFLTDWILVAYYGIMANMQDQILAKLSPEKKLEVAMQLYHSARELKAAGVRSGHPDWDENQVRQAVREAFLHARS